MRRKEEGGDSGGSPGKTYTVPGHKVFRSTTSPHQPATRTHTPPSIPKTIPPSTHTHKETERENILK